MALTTRPLEIEARDERLSAAAREAFRATLWRDAADWLVAQ